MLSVVTVSTLRKCAACVFGEELLDGNDPGTRKYSVSHVWFKLIFDCRVVNLEGIVERIEFNIEGRRVCGGAFASVYSIPLNTFKTLVRRVMRGDCRYVTYAGTRTCSKAKDKLTLVTSAE
eukprot:1118654-Pleurochrysis_carterae.AAC.1